MSSLRRAAFQVSGGIRLVRVERSPRKRASVLGSPKETITPAKLVHSRMPCKRERERVPVQAGRPPEREGGRLRPESVAESATSAREATPRGLLGGGDENGLPS